MICPKCGSISYNRFCSRCGISMTKLPKCGDCGKEIWPDNKFCGNCGLSRNEALNFPPPGFSQFRLGFWRELGISLREYFNF